MQDLAQFKNRRPTKQINVGGVPIGNRNPVSIQTMTTTLTCQVDETMHQIDRCAEAGAQIVRVAVPDAPVPIRLSTADIRTGQGV